MFKKVPIYTGHKYIINEGGVQLQPNSSWLACKSSLPYILTRHKVHAFIPYYCMSHHDARYMMVQK